MSNLPPSSSVSLAAPSPGILPESQSQPRGRGRGRSRGGIGKYLRARGRRGYGRPAEFSKRLLLEGEGNGADEEEAEQIEAENARKYSRRQLTSNADRYNEPEPELGSDGEVVVEPEVDLSTFLQKQKLSDDTQGPSSALFSKEDMDDVDDDDIDHSIAPLVASNATAQKKGKVTQIEWTPELDALHREKVAADAARVPIFKTRVVADLKKRFRAKSDKLHVKPVFSTTTHKKKADSALDEAPPLPLEQPSEPKDPMMEMEAFLDELLQ
ncbi:hypothetical protein M378DRAFT_178873 [Amanita muscaria Koide BX008]|uniref:Uncharacterized protein n=1 Tax=Amanita muscaria (strain Koide BX008) TaxID=946122 RepID=A0A0C2X541_AMAMK|nr:hypothetical protein M378DRAFT_178873 [Amanita muscaria Koide BX008]